MIPLTTVANLKHNNTTWFIRQYGNLGSCYFSKMKDCIRVGRYASNDNKEAVVAACVVERHSADSVIKLQILKGHTFSLPNSEILIQLIPVDESFVLNNPTSLGQGVLTEKIESHKINLDHAESKIIIKPLFNNQKILIRIILDYKKTPERARFSDWIGLGDVSCSNYTSFVDAVLENINSSDVIYPNLRYVSSTKNDSSMEKILITYCPVDTPLLKYSTFSIFYGYSGARLIINDQSNQWFRDGVAHLCSDISKIHNEIKRITALFSYRTAYGFSMGGYGAILFSSKMDIDRVIALNPQVRLFEPYCRSNDFILDKKHSILDITSYAKELSTQSQLIIVFGTQSTPDRRALDKLKNEISNGIAYYMVDDNHSLDRSMQDHSWLVELIESGSTNHKIFRSISK